MLKLLLVFFCGGCSAVNNSAIGGVSGCGEDERKSFGVARDGVGSAKPNVLPRNSVHNLGD